MSMKKKIPVGVILDSWQVPAWVFRTLEQIAHSSYAELKRVVVSPGETVEKATRKFDLYQAFRNYEDRKFQPKPDALHPEDARQLFAGMPQIELTGSPEANEKADGVDVLLHFSSQDLAGSWAPKYGIWKIVHGPDGRTPPGEEGFWEVVLQQPTTDSALCVFDGHGQLLHVLYDSHSSTNAFSVKKNINKVHWKNSLFIPRKLQQLHALGEEAFFSKGANGVVKRAHGAKTHRGRAFPIMQHALRFVRRKLYDLFYVDKWILLYKPDGNLNTPFSKYKKLMPPKDKFWADPHIISRDGKHYIYFEEAYVKEKKGFISLLTLDDTGKFSGPVKILEKPYHLSFPFVFEWQNQYYMIPETSKDASIQVYKCTEFPLKWEFHKYLMREIIAADVTLFPHEGRWWLFANVREAEGTSNWEELFLFYADNPLSEHWVRHPMNPIVSDVRKARPAGRIFAHDGALYRTSQNCSVRYGYGLNFHKIVKLTENDYREVDVKSVLPDWDAKIKGIHSFSFSGNLFMSDAIYKTRKF